MAADFKKRLWISLLLTIPVQTSSGFIVMSAYDPKQTLLKTQAARYKKQVDPVIV